MLQKEFLKSRRKISNNGQTIKQHEWYDCLPLGFLQNLTILIKNDFPPVHNI